MEIVEWINNGTVDVGFIIEETTKNTFNQYILQKMRLS